MDPNAPEGSLEFPGFASTSNDIPEEVDDATLSPTDHVFAPPPHVAARFHRSSANPRRRSSAASSRRTSISSSHSHHSARRSSLQAGCQSNHIAQHLRRASIIEDRKARLADRAAHAEQVRLRAALAKAAPPPRASNSEERALAAQLAREKHLAQVAAVCAEEVRRSKKIAEDMKERKAAEELKSRLEIQERQAEAERRRLEYMKNSRRPRTASVPASDSKKLPKRSLDQETATRRIQNAWRIRARKQVIQRFVNLGLSIDKVHDTSFDDISNLLAEEKVVQLTFRLLSLLQLFDSSDDPTVRKTSTRTFLSAYLILGHPMSILTSHGEQEQDLITKAKDLMISFETILSDTSPSLDSLSLAFTSYISAFRDWKARDSSKLIETMVANFVGLDAIWQTVKNDTEGGIADDYREGIRNNQVYLLSRIRKLAGPDRANTLIKKGIRESRKARPQLRPIGETRPRVVEPAASSHLSQRTLDELSPAPPTSNSQSNVLGSLFSKVPPNRILVHEIQIDKDFRIDADAQIQARTAIYRDICDQMDDGFARGEGALWTVAVAENIRVKLLSLLQAGNSLHTVISEALDPALIHTQCRQGVFSYGRFFSFMASMLPRLCAPYRDDQVKSLSTELERAAKQSLDTKEMLGTLFRLFQVIDVLSLDYVNFIFMSAVPTLLREAPGYERRIFESELRDGKITTACTRRWWQATVAKIMDDVERRDPLYGKKPSLEQVYARALVDTALGPSAAAARQLDSESIPETLALDSFRLSRTREHALRIATVGSILLTAKNLLKREVRSAWKTEATRIWDILAKAEKESADIPTRILSAIESSHAMPPQTRAHLLNKITRFHQLSTKNSDTSSLDPVPSLLHRRLRAHVLSRIGAYSSRDRLKAASNASAILAADGLAEFSQQVTEMVDLLGKMRDVDMASHSKWYEEIAEDVEKEREQSKEREADPGLSGSGAGQ